LSADPSIRRSVDLSICRSFDLSIFRSFDLSIFRSFDMSISYPVPYMPDSHFRRVFLLTLVVALTAGLLVVLQGFLLTILSAAVLAGLLYPVYTRLTRWFGGREGWAAGASILITFVLVVGPLLGLLSVVVQQAASITANIRPVVERAISEPTYLDRLLHQVPGYERVVPYREEILTKAGEVVNSLGSFLLTSLGDTTKGTVAFLFHFFIALYTVFFLLTDGPNMVQSMLDHLPLRLEEKTQLTDRFLSVTRATIKGTLVIGAAQGTLSGIAFWLAGIPNAAFWTVVMVVLSILPLIGGALVWVPAVVILFASGKVVTALVLATFCALVVGSIDNVLRPRLVGRDTKMHDLVILFSTLGGLAVFGPLGFIVGPVLAGLFVTAWQIFGVAYRDELIDGTPRLITPDGEDLADAVAEEQEDQDR
jgi:predicted PurR-regulated permease PerM